MNRMVRFILSSIIVAFAVSSLSVAGAVQIVAVVGKTVITDYELIQRAKIIALFQGYDQNDKHLMNQLERELTSVLIDEQIKMDYAEKANFTVNKEMIDRAIAEYAKKIGQPNIPSLKKYLALRGIDWVAFYDALKDEITWSYFMYAGVAAGIHVSGDEAGQRAKLRGLDHNSSSIILQMKQEIAQEKAALNVKKIISQMKRLHVVESFQ